MSKTVTVQCNALFFNIWSRIGVNSAFCRLKGNQKV